MTLTYRRRGSVTTNLAVRRSRVGASCEERTRPESGVRQALAPPQGMGALASTGTAPITVAVSEPHRETRSRVSWETGFARTSSRPPPDPDGPRVTGVVGVTTR